MNSREKVLRIFKRKSTGEAAFWTGHPNDETIPIYSKEWGIEPTREAIYSYLDDDARWLNAEQYYFHPDNLPMFDTGFQVNKSNTLSSAGCFAETEDVKEVEKYPWPDVKYLDFTDMYNVIDTFQDKMVMTGMWCPFFHLLHDFFGMENYFIKMYTDPDVVQAVTERMVDFYLQANAKWFDIIGDRMDAIFFGNDFGSQLDMLVSPEMFAKFIMPSFRKITAQAKTRGYKVVLHSCGAIESVIPQLIDAGVDCLHPIQAKARNMDAVSLARKYGNDIVFMGGVDTQDLLPFGTPEQVYDEVMRLREIFGPNFIVSPSHEAMPDTPPENMEAMAKAASC